MVSLLVVSVLVAPVVLVGVLFVPSLLVRGRWYKCPNCEEVFKGPALDRRAVGYGWSPAYLGRVPCPKCGGMRRRWKYQDAPEAP